MSGLFGGGVETLPTPPGMTPLEVAVRVAEAECESAGWEQPIRLFRLCWEDGCLAVRLLPFPDDAMRCEAASMLEAIADHIAGGGAAHLVGPTWRGWMVVYELWGIELDPADQAAMARGIVDHAAARLGDRPDRIELRHALAATVNGGRLAVCRVRDQLPDLFEPAWHNDVDAAALLRLVEISRRKAGGS